MSDKPWELKPGDIAGRPGWLRVEDGYEGREEMGFDIDPARISEPSKEEFDRLLAQERVLRGPLRRLPAQLKPADEVAALAVEAGLSETLKQWAYFHVLNRTISMKKGFDVLMTPSSQTLLEAAKILAKRKND